MTRQEMANYMQALFEVENSVRESAQKEYAHEEDNAFGNFERIASRLKCKHCGENFSREQILMVYMLKHVDGLIAHVNGETLQREPVIGRIHDTRIYGALLGGMNAEDDWEAEEQINREELELMRGSDDLPI